MVLAKEQQVRDLKAAPYNPRQITDQAFASLKKAMIEFGDLSGIVFNCKTGHLIGGHQRVKALDPSWPIVKAEVSDTVGTVAEGYVDTPHGRWLYREVDWPETKEKAANIAANKHGGEWDFPKLKDLLVELDTGDFDMDLTGFDEAELKKLIDWDGKHGLTDEDDVPEPPKVAITKPGDLWLLGEHRLLCGDATCAEDVARLMDGTVPTLMVTDPPYGVDYDGGAANKAKRQKIEGDDSTELFGPALAIAARHMPVGAWYVWHAGRVAAPVYYAIALAGFEVRSLLIWNKLKAHYGAPSAHYCQKHEPCLYAVRGNASFSGPSNECTVWDIDQPSRNEFHTTQKPVECMARPIRNHKAPQVYDPFLGSGTTLIAAEKLGRKCYALEIEPIYVDVAVKRWEQFTGQKAVRA